MPNAIRRLLSCSFSSSSPPPVSDAIASLFSLEWGKLRDSRESIWSDDLFFKSFQGPSVSSFICYLSFVFNKLEKRTPWIRVASSIRDVFVDIKESRSFLSFFLIFNLGDIYNYLKQHCVSSILCPSFDFNCVDRCWEKRLGIRSSLSWRMPRKQDAKYTAVPPATPWLNHARSS